MVEEVTPLPPAVIANDLNVDKEIEGVFALMQLNELTAFCHSAPASSPTLLTALRTLLRKQEEERQRKLTFPTQVEEGGSRPSTFPCFSTTPAPNAPRLSMRASPEQQTHLGYPLCPLPPTMYTGLSAGRNTVNPDIGAAPQVTAAAEGAPPGNGEDIAVAAIPPEGEKKAKKDEATIVKERMLKRTLQAPFEAFRGERDAVKLSDFYRRAEYLMRATGLPTEDWAAYLAEMHFLGPAKDWWIYDFSPLHTTSAKEGVKFPWEDFKDALGREFLPEGLEGTFRAQLWALRQGDHERDLDYVTKLDDLQRKAMRSGVKLHENEYMQAVYKTSRPLLARHLINMQVLTIKDAVRFVRGMDELLRDRFPGAAGIAATSPAGTTKGAVRGVTEKSSTTTQKNASNSSNLSSSSSSASSSSSSGEARPYVSFAELTQRYPILHGIVTRKGCIRCGKDGHHKTQCKAAKGDLLCWACGKCGHPLKECPNEKTTNLRSITTSVSEWNFGPLSSAGQQIDMSSEDLLEDQMWTLPEGVPRFPETARIRGNSISTQQSDSYDEYEQADYTISRLTSLEKQVEELPHMVASAFAKLQIDQQTSQEGVALIQEFMATIKNDLPVLRADLNDRNYQLRQDLAEIRNYQDKRQHETLDCRKEAFKRIERLEDKKDLPLLPEHQKRIYNLERDMDDLERSYEEGKEDHRSNKARIKELEQDLEDELQKRQDQIQQLRDDLKAEGNDKGELTTIVNGSQARLLVLETNDKSKSETLAYLNDQQEMLYDSIQDMQNVSRTMQSCYLCVSVVISQNTEGGLQLTPMQPECIPINDEFRFRDFIRAVEKHAHKVLERGNKFSPKTPESTSEDLTGSMAAHPTNQDKPKGNSKADFPASS